MQRRAPIAMRTGWNKVLQLVAAVAVAASLAPSAADAAPRKGSVVKKQHASAKRAPRALVAVKKRPVSVVRIVPAKPSFGQLAGLHGTQDELDLKSSVALVID